MSSVPNPNQPPKKPQGTPGAAPGGAPKPPIKPQQGAAAPKPQPGAAAPKPQQGAAAPKPQQGQPPAKPGGPAPVAKQPQPQQLAAKPKPPGEQKPAAQQGAAPGAKAPAPKPASAAPGAKPAKRPPPQSNPVPAKQASKVRGRKIGQVFIDLGFIDEDQLWELLDEAKNTGVPVGQVALSRGLLTEDQLMQALADQFGLRVVTAEELKPSEEALKLVPETMASVYKVMPLTFKDDTLTVVLGDPANLPSLDDLRNFLGIKEVVATLSNPTQIAQALERCYKGKEETIMDIIQSLDDDGKGDKRRGETSIDLESVMEIQDSAPVRKLLNMVMLLAIKDRASDIHFEPFEEEYKMRYRCDGVLYEMVPPPRHLANAISSRIKVMSNLDIAERRLPQDGRIELNVGGNPVDMRVSILPTLFGEACVIRVLDRTNTSLDLAKVGMEPGMLATFNEMIHKPNGIVLVTGPTGSGKTTTLYSALSALNDVTTKVITTEDPIEYDIDGLVQVPINAEIGVTFALALRAILRQDPDVILVGEIRDLETARIAIESAMTGHLVFSTLHTNDAPGTITRLRDMGVETFMITATVEGILAQRLVRKICEDCRAEFEPSPEILMELNLRPDDVKGKKFYYGKGCDRCNNTGHRGRMGIFELIAMNDELRDMISAGASTDQLRSTCRKQGMTTLRESGLRAIFNGLTTIEEVVNETVMEDEA